MAGGPDKRKCTGVCTYCKGDAPLVNASSCTCTCAVYSEKDHTWREEREAVLALARNVLHKLSQGANGVIVNGDDSRNKRYKAAASAMREFIAAIERGEHLKPNIPITLL